MEQIVSYLASFWLRNGRYLWSRIRRQLFERSYLATLLPSTNSVEEIQSCLQQVQWTMDGPLHLFDCISYPQTTWAKKKDDCDGFATLAAELLNRWSPDRKPVLITAAVRPFQQSHTVCAFSGLQGELCFFDNSSLRCEDIQTYEDVAKHIAKVAKRLICWGVRDPNTLELLEFHTC